MRTYILPAPDQPFLRVVCTVHATASRFLAYSSPHTQTLLVCPRLLLLLCGWAPLLLGPIAFPGVRASGLRTARGEVGVCASIPLGHLPPGA